MIPCMLPSSSGMKWSEVSALSTNKVKCSWCSWTLIDVESSTHNSSSTVEHCVLRVYAWVCVCVAVCLYVCRMCSMYIVCMIACMCVCVWMFVRACLCIYVCLPEPTYQHQYVHLLHIWYVTSPISKIPNSTCYHPLSTFFFVQKICLLKAGCLAVSNFPAEESSFFQAHQAQSSCRWKEICG